MTFFTSDYQSFKEKSIGGRYINYQQIAPLLQQLNGIFEVMEVGKSVQGTAIDSITFGKGKRKILMWSQMHGNESTTTKAVIDLLNFMSSGNELTEKILSECTIKIIPMLNPDGAEKYTRANANGIDLNRDAQELSQPESVVLRNAYDNFRPNFCFNLHDQRTMYNVGESKLPATVSFLAPSMDAQRSISPTRGESMQLIVAMNNRLQQLVPGQIGRYDDGFNSDCVGDTFQMLGATTVLFEAGHHQNDYERERTRECIFVALITSLDVISRDGIKAYSQDDYSKIPENGKRFFDVLIKNAHNLNSDYDKGVHLGIRFEEELFNAGIRFEPKLASVFGSEHYCGHQTFDCAKPADLRELRKISIFLSLISK